MGCFNHKCNFSQLPIQYDDRVVVIIGVVPEKLDTTVMSIGMPFTPISVPIRGYYNDYGSIERVDRTPAIDVLEKFFDLKVEEIVDYAERCSCGCEDQVEEDGVKVNKVLEELKANCYSAERGLALSYIMVHERIFDYLVSKSNPKKKDRYFWRIPHKYIEDLGYKKNLLGKENGYDVIRWEHDTLPVLKEMCYVWKENEFGNYGHTVHTMSQLCKMIGCDVPAEYEVSFFADLFKREVEQQTQEYKDKAVIGYYLSLVGKTSHNETITQAMVDEMIERYKRQTQQGKDYDYDLISRILRVRTQDGYTFTREKIEQGLFYIRMCLSTDIMLAQFGFGNEHLELKYMHEIIQIAALLDTLYNFEMTWGCTSSYKQDIDWDQHIEFMQECLSIANEKKNGTK